MCSRSTTSFDSSIVSTPMMQRTMLMNSAKLSERMTPMLWASLFQRQAGRDRGADQADEAEPGNRHALAGLAECLGQHGGNRPRARR